jgi:hypothetical protein
MLISARHESACKFWITLGDRDAQKMPLYERRICAPVIAHLTHLLTIPASTKKNHRLQHEQSISAADLANQRFLGSEKFIRGLDVRSEQEKQP